MADAEPAEAGQARPGGDGDEELGLEERLERLDEIVGSLEADDVGLEKALELFEEGVRHVRKAEELLAEAELKVEELVGEEEEMDTRPLDPEAP